MLKLYTLAHTRRPLHNSEKAPERRGEVYLQEVQDVEGQSKQCYEK